MEGCEVVLLLVGVHRRPPTAPTPPRSTGSTTRWPSGTAGLVALRTRPGGFATTATRWCVSSQAQSDLSTPARARRSASTSYPRC